MKNWFLSNPYLIRLINQKLFTIVFSSLILLLKKNEYFVLLLQNLYLVQLFHIHTMIIFMHGSSSCYTKMLLWPALGLLSLIKISILSFLCGLSIGGHNLALLLIFFPDLWLAPSSILQVFLTQTHMMLTAKFPASLHFVKKYKVPWILKWQYVKEGNVLTWQWYVKWWDTFSHTQDVIDNVTQKFLATSQSTINTTT